MRTIFGFALVGGLLTLSVAGQSLGAAALYPTEEEVKAAQTAAQNKNVTIADKQASLHAAKNTSQKGYDAAKASRDAKYYQMTGQHRQQVDAYLAAASTAITSANGHYDLTDYRNGIGDYELFAGDDDYEIGQVGYQDAIDHYEAAVYSYDDGIAHANDGYADCCTADYNIAAANSILSGY